jgi:hypothetical protein
VTSVTLESALSRTACVERLNAAADQPWSFSKTHEARGRAKADSLWLMKNIDYRNSWQTVLRARLEDQGGGTRIECRFGINRFVLALTVLWFGFALLFALTALATWIEGAHEHLGWQIALGSIFFPLPAAAIVAVGRWFARNDKRFLIDFICHEIDARVVDSPVSR